VTTNSFLSNIRWAKLGIFSFSSKPLDYISYLAFIFGVFHGIEHGLLRGGIHCLALPGYRASRARIHDLLLLILFFGSVQLVCFSILGRILEPHVQRDQAQAPLYRARYHRQQEKTEAGSEERKGLCSFETDHLSGSITMWKAAVATCNTTAARKSGAPRQ